MKLTRTVPLCGALIALPLGVAAVYGIYQDTTRSAEALCSGLRTSIVSVLETEADTTVKRALVDKDLAEFERSCALSDPGAQAVFSALDRTILFTGQPEAGMTPDSRPVRFVPPPRRDLQHRWPGVLPPPPPEEFRRRPYGT